MDESRPNGRQDILETYLARASLFAESVAALSRYTREATATIASQGPTHREAVKSAPGVEAAAYQRLTDAQASPELYFCTPGIIRDLPRLSEYYRLVAMLPKKAISRLKVGSLQSQEGADVFCAVVNATVSSFVLNLDQEAVRLLAPETLVFTQLGDQLGGSWRNVVGRQGGALFARTVCRWLLGEKVTLAVEPASIDPFELAGTGDVEVLQQPKVIRDSAGELFEIAFAQEPDIAVYRFVGGDRKLVCWIELKSGTDPAGAQERYGSARKSFEKAQRHPDRPRKMLIMAVYTEAVLDMIEQDRAVDEYYHLLRIGRKGPDRKRFLASLKLQLGL